MATTYQETIDFLFSRLPMFSRIGAAAYKPDLSNTIRLCEALGNPHLEFNSIHVAGTNGKGSTSHMLAAIFQEAGYKTGLYTSPHLQDFRERIKINGELADKDFVIDFTEKIKPLIEEIEPSFFEITACMAFAYFASQKVDIAIIETGMGGRLDSTNVIKPILSIITNIGWDHMAILGDTRPKIAQEKAGIIKDNTPVVIGETDEEIETVFRTKALEKNAHVYFGQDHYQVLSNNYRPPYLHANLHSAFEDIDFSVQLDLPGFYQLKNLPAVFTACELLDKKEWNIPLEKIIAALKKVKTTTGLSGRWDIIQFNPTVVLDVAHNPDGMQQVLMQLQLSQFEKLFIITGMVKDKDVKSTLALLPKNAEYFFTQAHIPRAMPKEELQQLALHYQLQGPLVENVNEGISRALKLASPNDLILVCGSVFLVGEVDKNIITNG